MSRKNLLFILRGSATPLVLLLVALIAIFAVWGAYNSKGPESSEFWAIVAAVLSVLVASLSAWSSQRMISLQEQERWPDIIVNLEVLGPSGHKVLSLMNVGKTVAYSVQVSWKSPVGVGAQDIIRVDQVRPGANMEWQLSNAFTGNDSCYEALVTWEAGNGRIFSKSYFDSDSDIHARALPVVRHRNDQETKLAFKIADELKNFQKVLSKDLSEASTAIDRLAREVRHRR